MSSYNVEHKMYLDAWLVAFGVGAPNVEVNHIHADDRDVEAGDVFISLSDVPADALLHIERAINNGAVAVLVEARYEREFKALANNHDVALVPVSELRQLLPQLVSRFYSDVNALDPTIIGVTGTNGKTTTSQFIAQLSSLYGLTAGVIGTNGVGVPPNLHKIRNTTPGVVELYRHFDRLIKKDSVDVISMEVSSHGLVQERVAGVRFAAGVITNITQDHLDYHETMEAYEEAKLLLFSKNYSQSAVVNYSDPRLKAWVDDGKITQDLILVARQGEYDPKTSGKPYKYLLYKLLGSTPRGAKFSLESSWGSREVELPIFGEFNVQNFLLATGALLHCYLPFGPLVAQATRLKPIPGRVESFAFNNDKATAIVDFAHTPDALRNVLETLKAHSAAKLTCIFGCGGNRDASKRPQMGRIAYELADQVIVTSDNPRHEDPKHIIEQICQGMTASAEDDLPETVDCIIDRQAAIRAAFEQAVEGEVILIAGKGHETTQIFGDEVQHYDERQYVAELAKEFAGEDQ